jgi:Rrf2 family protein
VRVSAKVDYAVRAAVELASSTDGEPVKAQAIAEAQSIPLKFLENILQQLRQADLVESTRGPHGGHRLARPAADIALADIIRAVDGPLGVVAGHRPEDVDYAGSAKPLIDVWIAVRASLRDVLEHVSLEQVAAGKLPREVSSLTARPDAWTRRAAAR